jgi:hypothetical protein
VNCVARGPIRKMTTRLETPVHYALPIGQDSVPLNPLLGSALKLHFTGQINCVHCGRNTNKSFNQGYCYPCFQKLAQCDSCIISPEKCHFDLGTCREPEWGEKYCMQDHIVYLANSSGVKVGITRATQVPTRWIDQGAVQALAIARVRTRLQSGSLEVLFKQHVSDKTNWRDMLKSCDHHTDLHAERDRLVAECQKDIDDLVQRFGFHAISVLSGIDTVQIEYPVLEYPEKVSSFNFDKDPTVEGTLLGIKGQYLIFDTGVINLRRFGGYNLEFFTS